MFCAASQYFDSNLTTILDCIYKTTGGVRTLIPEFYDYTYDGCDGGENSFFIADGGRDMFDAGNQVCFTKLVKPIKSYFAAKKIQTIKTNNRNQNTEVEENFTKGFKGQNSP